MTVGSPFAEKRPRERKKEFAVKKQRSLSRERNGVADHQARTHGAAGRAFPKTDGLLCRDSQCISAGEVQGTLQPGTSF